VVVLAVVCCAALLCADFIAVDVCSLLWRCEHSSSYNASLVVTHSNNVIHHCRTMFHTQGMSYLVATLLLYMDEFEAFKCLANLLGRR
jgi:hypothetical protein